MISHYPGRKQEKLARQCGFGAVMHEEVAGGLMGILVATKTDRK